MYSFIPYQGPPTYLYLRSLDETSRQTSRRWESVASPTKIRKEWMAACLLFGPGLRTVGWFYVKFSIQPLNNSLKFSIEMVFVFSIHNHLVCRHLSSFVSTFLWRVNISRYPVPHHSTVELMSKKNQDPTVLPPPTAACDRPSLFVG